MVCKMIEYALHNVRFYNYVPKSVHCMSYDEGSSKLAVLRFKGFIEIWNCSEVPFCEDVIKGSEGFIDSLVWCDGRLFGAGLEGFIIEYSISKLTTVAETSVTGGPVWCLAASYETKKIAAGTEGGYICLFDVVQDGLLFDKMFTKQEGRILSMAWHRSDEYLVTGCVGFVKVWSYEKGQVTSNFAVSIPSKKSEVIVWCVAILNDFTVISGDSSGKTCFWNGKLGVILCSIQTHKAAILCMQVDKAEKKVYVAGIDPTIVILNPAGGKGSASWVTTYSRSVHTHDVRAMAILPNSYLFSGGVDTVLTVSYGPPRTVIQFPTMSVPGYISVGGFSRTLLLCQDKTLSLWRLGVPYKDGNSAYFQIAENHIKLVELKSELLESVVWCSVSPKGLWIAYVLHSGKLRIFRCYYPDEENSMSMRRTRSISDDVESSRRIAWVSEGLLASVTDSGAVQLLAVTEVEAFVEKTLSSPCEQSVRGMQCSSDGSLLGVLYRNNSLTVWNTNDGSNIVTLPKMSSSITAFGINHKKRTVFTAHANFSLSEYSIDRKAYTPFSKVLRTRNELSFSHIVISQISFDPANPNLVFLHNGMSIIVLNEQDFCSSVNNNSTFNSNLRGKKRRGCELDGMDSSVLEDKHKGLLVSKRSNYVLNFQHSGSVKTSFLLCVEIDPFVVIDQLPPPFITKKYGCS